MKKPIVIGVAGGTGSGKTTLVRAIADKINHSDIVVIQHDSFYKDRSHLPPSEREKLNHDHPDALETSLLLQNLKDLVAGNPVEIPEYDFVSHPKTKPQFFYPCVRSADFKEIQ
jgi:uridine kinase